ncbi:glycosyltransferase family 4 protein [Luteibacter sp. 9133]|uniref:glycosyltransferase family 4 protein n=1 Tax=Luteibacter sp. 9133 TaxID=1500891 RepID=UPI0005B8B18A|nr:glycosyltransferase family 4 protein [Luteibacter sp. 9133]
MNILMVSTSYPADERDWRGVFIRHLAAGIARLPGTRLRLWSPPGVLPYGVEAATTPREANWLKALMVAGGISHLMRENGWRAGLAPVRLIAGLRACYKRETVTDIYHINWLQCALPLPNDGKPAVVSILGNDLNLLRLPGIKMLLRRRLRKRESVLCPNAEWMVPLLKEAFGDIARIVPVSFGIDDAWFKIHRAPVRPNRWIAVTRLTANKLGPLFQWAEPLFSGSERELHLFGPMQEHTDIPPWVHYHGAATPEDLATTWFPDARGLITLSVHAEGRPQTMLEAMASGLPIIASNMPAHATIIEHERTGFLCSSPTEFTASIHALESDDTAKRVSEQCRQWAKETFGSWDDAAARYASIYATLGNPHGE